MVVGFAPAGKRGSSGELSIVCTDHETVEYQAEHEANLREAELCAEIPDFCEEYTVQDGNVLPAGPRHAEQAVECSWGYATSQPTAQCVETAVDGTTGTWYHIPPQFAPF